MTRVLSRRAMTGGVIMPQLGKIFIIVGVLCVMIGVVMVLAPKIPFIGRLPGDIYIKKENFTFYFPIATSIVISVILSLLFWIFRGK